MARKQVVSLFVGALTTNRLLAGSVYIASGELWLELRLHPVSCYEPDMMDIPAGHTANIVPEFAQDEAPFMF